MKNFLLSAAVTVFLLSAWAGNAIALTPLEELGEQLYFDVNLSEPSGQSCSSCHDPNFGFVDPDSNLPVSEGVILNSFGNRNSPSSAYAMYAPVRYFDETEGLWIGGQFWDSRATGELLGDPLADQALGPFLNPVEMANSSKAQVIEDVEASAYAGLFEQVWGVGSLDNTDEAYDQVALSIAAFERTTLFAPFDSKYDRYLAACLKNGGEKDDCAQGNGKIAAKTGHKVFSQEEWKGMQLFMGKAMCVACHVADWADPDGLTNPVVVPSWSPDGTIPPMFTDFTYDNLGVPKNIEYPLDGQSFDLGFYGLGLIVGDDNENGKFKVMSLRNIALTAPYAHNGYFKSLKEITHFYNTRDVAGALKNGDSWPAPEYPVTVNTNELGNLGLSDAEEDAIVEFMKTLTDGYRP